MPITIFFYIARKYLGYLLGVFVISLAIVILFETLEMTKIMFGRSLSFSVVIQMAFLKNFIHIQRAFAFIVLLSAILLYVNLNQKSELVVMRSSRISTLQFSLPCIVVAFIFGIIHITALNPIASVFISKYEKLENQYLKNSTSQFALLKTGLWMKQVDKNGHKNIMHATRISQENSELYDICVYFLDSNNNFEKRIDAEYAKLHDGKWELKQAIETAQGHHHYKHERIELPASVTFSQIQESMIQPETLSFWKMPTFITIAEESGFSVVKHKLYFYKLLMIPFFFAAMACLGIAFALAKPRTGNMAKYSVTGLIIGFLIYFSSDIISALGISGSIPVLISVVSPTFITLIIAVYTYLHHEDA